VKGNSPEIKSKGSVYTQRSARDSPLKHHRIQETEEVIVITVKSVRCVVKKVKPVKIDDIYVSFDTSKMKDVYLSLLISPSTRSVSRRILSTMILI
jgi:hypothetical protein